MCGRTACTLAPDDVCKACSYNDGKGKTKKPLWRDAPGGHQYYPSYNVSPGSHTPVLLSSKHYPGELEGISDQIIQPMMWGLVPSWHKGDPKKVSYETNNCRAEGMLEKRTFKTPLDKGRRCVVLADGFFEWKRDKNQKQPYFIYFPSSSTGTAKTNDFRIKEEVKNSDSDWTDLKKEPCDWLEVKSEPGENTVHNVPDSKGQPDKKELDPNTVAAVSGVKDVKDSIEIKTEIKMESSDSVEEAILDTEFPDGENDSKSQRLLTMAGVFDIWKPPDGAPPLYSYSIITVAASAAMDWLHHRMPAILTSQVEINDWLDFGEVPLSMAVNSIRPVECIQLHPVSTVVNNSRNKTPDCVEPVDLKKPKLSASSNLMMSWLSKPKKEGISGISPEKSSESPPKKKKKTESSLMMGWLNKAKKS